MTTPPEQPSEVERVARAMCFADYDTLPEYHDEFWHNPSDNPWMMLEDDEWDNGVLVRLGRNGYRRHARAAIEAMQRAATPAPVQDDDAECRAWAWLQEYSQQRFCEHPCDVSFDGDQMVDAFIAGIENSARLSTDTALVEAATTLLNRCDQHAYECAEPVFLEERTALRKALASRGGDNGKTA